jgi:uncharacterized YccA/Bax inhibitor family protein
MNFILAVTVAQRRHMQEIGLIISAVGGLAIILSGAFGLRSMSRTVERTTMVVAGLLLTVGFGIQLLALHAPSK